jgi:parvulin-like peptidyl-prolyl isomerase
VKRSGKFPKRYLVYLIAVVYLFCDLYWLKGPLYRRVEYRGGAAARAQRAIEEGRWVATVNTHPLTRPQLDLATAIYIYRRGETADEMSAVATRTTRRAVMQQLVNDELVRQYALAEEFIPDPQAVERRVAAFKDQFDDEGAMDERLAAQGLSREELEELIHQHVAQQLWLEKRISPAVQVEDQEALDWYEKNRGNPEATGFAVPDIVRARHIFISTIENDGEERKTLIDGIYRQLIEGKRPFAELAGVHSEDERSKKKGGDLGWFGRHRMPEDFIERIFSLQLGETSPPFHSSLGWHIVELTGRKPARDLSFEEMKPEIVAWLENNKREEVLRIFLLKLRKASNIVIYPQNF